MPLSPSQQRRQHQELLKLQQQQALQQTQQSHAKLSGWGNVAKQPVATKSLLEIQREEAQQMKQRKEQQHQQQHPIATPQPRPQNKTVRRCFFPPLYLKFYWIRPHKQLDNQYWYPHN